MRGRLKYSFAEFVVTADRAMDVGYDCQEFCFTESFVDISNYKLQTFGFELRAILFNYWKEVRCANQNFPGHRLLKGLYCCVNGSSFINVATSCKSAGVSTA